MSSRNHDDPSIARQSATDKVAGRRRLLKLGAGVAPVLMAIGSRSAFACHSTTPSAFGSVCTSRPELVHSSNGCDPHYWKNNPKKWPYPYLCRDEGDDDDRDDDDDDDDDRDGGKKKNKKDDKKGNHGQKATTFNSVFGSSPFHDSVTLLQVLQSSGSGSAGVARCCVAALFNARTGRTPETILSADDVIHRIWHEYMAKGYFEPVAGVRWYSDSPRLPYIPGSNTGGKGGIIGYLNTTWT